MMKILQIGGSQDFTNKKITFTYLNHKLCAKEYIIILSNYKIHVYVPADGYYKSSRSSLVLHTDKLYVTFTITLAHTSFWMFVGMYIFCEECCVEFVFRFLKWVNCNLFY